MNNLFYLIVLIVLNLILIIFINKIKNFVNVFDNPDGIRKFQKIPIPPIGGVIFLYNLLILLIIAFFDRNFSVFDKIFFEISNENYLRGYFSFFITSIIFFIIGLYDDKKNLAPTTKIFLLLFILLCTILIDETLILKELRFHSFNHIIILNNFSYIFTILCIIFLLNALNLYDGINLQSGLNFLLIYFYLLSKDIFSMIILAFIIGNTIFLYLNFKNKIFLGDNGVFINSFIISYFIIKSYNYNLDTSLKCDEILLLFLIPSLDLIRLFISRIMNLKNPFLGDRNHIHHLLLKKFGNIYLVNLILISLSGVPILIYVFTDFNLLALVFIVMLIYLIILLSLKRLTKYEHI